MFRNALARSPKMAEMVVRLEVVSSRFQSVSFCVQRSNREDHIPSVDRFYDLCWRRLRGAATGGFGVLEIQYLHQHQSQY